MNNIKEIENKHISVLLNELVEAIEIKNDKKNIIVDATLGMGGHASKIIEKMNIGDTFIGFDADIKNLELARTRLEEINKNKKVEIILINSNFGNLKVELEKIGIKKITGIYYDLGLSSLHLDEADRGFSFMLNGPLDMRLDKSKGKTAADIVNSYKDSELRDIFLKYGEEPQSNKIAKNIVELRRKKRFETTSDLSEIITGGPKAKSRIFQAIRIEVNGELEMLEKSLHDAIDMLEKDSVIFVISFHSLEDRITKNIFRDETRDCICDDLICSCGHVKSLKTLNKKPILPTPEEIKNNSRSRSAKARFAKKII
ncbi:MAG: 16S rRNA (cytosine(1402)-N(4))-methyltransferase RsmH [Candidatus Gracilibacteria bacterium]|nr:16S rRNA (cytosine(1402)-N(4))-methyltransferase RsmH [Candidatus Gracilibacteria bacterium]